MDELLEQLIEENRHYTKEGRLANYIPELAKANQDDLGIYVVSSDGKTSFAGDFQKRFTIQSIVKPLFLLLALMDNGEEMVRAHVGVEATGKPFDAINYTDQALLSEHLNPMVNMGAILLCTLIKGETYETRFQRLLELTRKVAGNPDIDISQAVYESEKRTGSRNRALAFLLKSHGLIQDDVEEVLDCYFKACSILVNCKDQHRLRLCQPGPPPGVGGACVLQPLRPLCQCHPHDLWHVQRRGRLCHQGGTARQERCWRRHYGRLPHPYGYRHLLPRPG